MLGEGWSRVAGGLLAALLLLVFSGALLSVIARGLSISCGCFGARDDHPVSSLDLVCNLGLLVCSALALVPAFIAPSLIYSLLSLSLLTASGAATFVERLPRSYETMLGRMFEKGEQLSIGQWQKIALSRAFMSLASVVVLDEPTASIDAEAEAEIFGTLSQAARGATTLLIAHRFACILTIRQIQ